MPAEDRVVYYPQVSSCIVNKNVQGRVPPLESADERTFTDSLRPNVCCR